MRWLLDGICFECQTCPFASNIGQMFSIFGAEIYFTSRIEMRLVPAQRRKIMWNRRWKWRSDSVRWMPSLCFCYELTKSRYALNCFINKSRIQTSWKCAHGCKNRQQSADHIGIDIDSRGRTEPCNNGHVCNVWTRKKTRMKSSDDNQKKCVCTFGVLAQEPLGNREPVSFEKYYLLPVTHISHPTCRSY